MRNLFLLFLFSLILLFGCAKERKELTSNETNDVNSPQESLRPKIEMDTLVLKPTVREKAASEIEKKVYQKAHDLWYNDRPKEAVVKLKNFIINYSNSSLADNAQGLIGTAYTNLENYNKAIDEYKKVKNKYPKSNTASISLYNIAYVYFYKLKDFPNAKKYYELFIQEATENDKEWCEHAIDNLNNWEFWTDVYKDNDNKKKVYSTDNSSDPKKEFEKWLYSNTDVTEVHYDSDWQIWVTLESYKYTSEENVEQIAETIARWYAQKMNKSFTVCTVWRGNSIYAKGNYSR